MASTFIWTERRRSFYRNSSSLDLSAISITRLVVTAGPAIDSAVSNPVSPASAHKLVLSFRLEICRDIWA